MLFFIYEEDKAKILFPLHNIYTSLEEIAKDIEDCASEIETYREEDMHVHQFALLVPLAYARPYRLKKEFWENPSEKYESDDRMRAFLYTMGEKKLKRKLLVTPNPFDTTQKTGGFAAALPFFEKDEHMIEHFMRKSDWPVEITAKESAIYDMGDIMVFNWKTKSFEEREQESEQMLN